MKDDWGVTFPYLLDIDSFQLWHEGLQIVPSTHPLLDDEMCLTQEKHMRTPAGFDCDFFFGDYYRGRSREECRLIGKHPRPNQWKPNLCKTCPVPGILRANSCRFMTLQAHVEESFLGLIRGVKVSAYCSESQSIVAEPHVGCGLCHPLPPEFDIKKP